MRWILLACALATLGCSRDALPEGFGDGGGAADLAVAPPNDLAQPAVDLATACLPGKAMVDGALADGTTLRLRFAWVGYGFESQLTAFVHLTVDATLPANPSDANSVRVQLLRRASGQQMVMVTPQQSTVVGTAIIDLADPPPWQGGPPSPRIRGFLKVGDGGLALSGSFEAVWCPLLDAISP